MINTILQQELALATAAGGMQDAILLWHCYCYLPHTKGSRTSALARSSLENCSRLSSNDQLVVLTCSTGCSAASAARLFGVTRVFAPCLDYCRLARQLKNTERLLINVIAGRVPRQLLLAAVQATAHVPDV